MEERKERREGKGKRVREGREKKREGRGLLPLTSFTLKSSLLVYTLFLEVRFPRKSKIQQEAPKKTKLEFVPMQEIASQIAGQTTKP